MYWSSVPVFNVKGKQWYYVFLLAFKINLCLATSFKRSRRELSIDVADHRSMLKNNQNTYYPRFSFTPTTGMELPETSVLLLQ